MPSDRVALSAMTVFLCLAGTDAVAGQEVGPLIERVLEAYGGRARLEEVHSYRFEASMTALERGMRAGVERVSRGHDSLDVVVHYPHRVEIRRLDRGRGWRGESREALQEVRGPMLDSMRTQAMRANLPWVLAEMYDQVELIDSGDEHFLLGVRLTGEAAIRFWVENATGRVTRSEAIVGVGPTVMAFATDYSDFRVLEGVLFPFHEESWAQGRHTASLDVDSVEWNPPEDPERRPE